MKVLFAERDKLSKKLDELFNERRELFANHKKANDVWYQWSREDRARKAEAAKQRQAEYQKQKKMEQIERAKEQASLPAFEVEISQCNALAIMLRQMTVEGYSPAAQQSASGSKVVAGASLPVARQASDALNLPKGVKEATVLKKKSDRFEEETLFQATKKTKRSGTGSSTAAPKDTDKLKFDLSVMDQFLSLKVDLPTKYGDIAKTVDALDKKKQYFLENQERKTKENIEKAKALEEKLLKSLESSGVDAEAAAAVAVDEKENQSEENVVAAVEVATEEEVAA